MSILEDKANAMAGALVNRRVKEAVALDPAMILMLMELIMGLLKMFQDCRKTPAEVVQSTKRLGIIERWQLRRAIRQSIADDEMHGYVGRQLADAAAEVAQSLTAAEVEELYAEV